VRNLAALLPRKFCPLALLLLLTLFALPDFIWAFPENSGQAGQELSTETEELSEFLYAWTLDNQKYAWPEGDSVQILDTAQHTLAQLHLPTYPNLVRLVIDLGFNPDGTKIFVISILEEAETDSTVMELQLFSLEGKVLGRQVFTNLAEADWIREDEIILTQYQDISGEVIEYCSWNLLTGELRALPEKITEADN